MPAQGPLRCPLWLFFLPQTPNQKLPLTSWLQEGDLACDFVEERKAGPRELRRLPAPLLTCIRHLCGLLPHPLRTCSRTRTPSEEDGPLSQHPRPAGPHVPMTLTLSPDKIPSLTCILRQLRPPYFHSCPQQRSGRMGLPLSAVSTSTGFSAGGSHRHGHWEVSRPQIPWVLLCLNR